MKPLLHIERTVQKQQRLYHTDDITQALFYSQPPTFTDTPFSRFRKLHLANTRITFAVSLLELQHGADLTSLGKLILRVGDRDVRDPSAIRTLAPWMIDILSKSYLYGRQLWADYITDTMHDYVKDTESQIHWSVFCHMPTAVFTAPLTFEQKLWVSANTSGDRKDITDFVFEIRESLLPWFNNELWQQVDKKKKNTRVNVDYEVQHKKFLSGAMDAELDDLDVIT